MGIAEDVSHFLNLVFSCVICAVISFIYGWKLTLIVISYLPIVFATNIIIGKVSFYLQFFSIKMYKVVKFHYHVIAQLSQVKIVLIRKKLFQSEIQFNEWE